jgi:hypothetical protein
MLLPLCQAQTFRQVALAKLAFLAMTHQANANAKRADEIAVNAKNHERLAHELMLKAGSVALDLVVVSHQPGDRDESPRDLVAAADLQHIGRSTSARSHREK